MSGRSPRPLQAAATEVLEATVTSLAPGGAGVVHVEHGGERRAVFLPHTPPGPAIRPEADFLSRPARGAPPAPLARGGGGAGRDPPGAGQGRAARRRGPLVGRAARGLLRPARTRGPRRHHGRRRRDRRRREPAGHRGRPHPVHDRRGRGTAPARAGWLRSGERSRQRPAPPAPRRARRRAAPDEGRRAVRRRREPERRPRRGRGGPRVRRVGARVLRSREGEPRSARYYYYYYYSPA